MLDSVESIECDGVKPHLESTARDPVKPRLNTGGSIREVATATRGEEERRRHAMVEVKGGQGLKVVGAVSSEALQPSPECPERRRALRGFKEPARHVLGHDRIAPVLAERQVIDIV